MATPPSLIDIQESSFSTTTTPKSVTISWNAGDIIVFVGQMEGWSSVSGFNASLTPTATGLTFTEQQAVVVEDYGYVRVMTATPGSSGSSVSVSCAKAGNTDTYQFAWGFTVEVWRGSDGVGASSKTNVSSGAPSLALTTTAANSAIIVANNDWNATDGASRTWRTVNSITPTSGNGYETNYFRDAARYATYAGYYPDAGTAGSKTVGLSAPSGQKYSIIALEILGAAGGAAYTLTANQGSFALTGQAAVTRLGRKTAAQQGSYSLTGQTAGLKRGPKVVAAQGSYALTGQAAGVITIRTMVAAAGSYGLTGQTAALRRGFMTAAEHGAYALTGQAASLVALRTMLAAAGAYALSGQDVVLSYSAEGSFTLIADQGSIALTGFGAALRADRRVTAAQGSYALTGYAATLGPARRIVAERGTYSITGIDVALNYSGGPPPALDGIFIFLRRRRR